NPRVVEVLAGTAEVARAEEEYWREVVERRLLDVASASGKVQNAKLAEAAGDAGEAPGPQPPVHRASLLMMAEALAAEGNSKFKVQSSKLLELPLAMQRRVVRGLAEAAGVRLDFEHGEQVLHAVRTGGSRTVELPGGARARV